MAVSVLRSSVLRSCAPGAVAALACSLFACSIVTSLDGLSGGSGAADGGSGGSLNDTGAPSEDGGSPLEDAGSEGESGDPGSSVSEDAGTAEAAAVDAGHDADSAAPPHDSGPIACVPTALACDGKVHECNGVVDEGCPKSIVIGAPGAGQILGGDTSVDTPFSDPCPAGQVLIGIGGSTGQWIDAVYGICGVVGLTATTSTDPYTYSVTISSGTTLATEGVIASNDATWKATCPANEAVVSVAGSSGIAMDRIVLSCAPLTITGAPAPGSFTLHQGNVTVLAGQGDTSGGSPFTPIACPDPQVVALVSGNAGSWVDALGVGCATPVIDLVP